MDQENQGHLPIDQNVEKQETLVMELEKPRKDFKKSYFIENIRQTLMSK